MRKRRREQRHVRMARMRKRLWRHTRMQNVLDALKCNLTIKEIHRKTGLSEKSIRKIINENPAEFTFLLLKKEDKEC